MRKKAWQRGLAGQVRRVSRVRDIAVQLDMSPDEYAASALYQRERGASMMGSIPVSHCPRQVFHSPSNPNVPKTCSGFVSGVLTPPIARVG